MLCLLAAIIFWVFNALNKEYTSNIKFPLRFDYDTVKATPAQPLPTSLLVNVSGNGWELFREGFGYKIPSLTIPLEKPLEVKKIVGSTLLPLLANQIGKLQINYVVTDTLFLQLDQRDTHTYKLFVDSREISFSEGYGQVSPIVILPDSVKLQGPKSLLHKLPDSLVITLPGKKLSSDFRELLEINLPNIDMITRYPASAEIIFEVNEISLLVINTKVEIRNLAKSKQATLSQDSVAVQIQIPIARKEEFEKKTLSSFVDLKRLKKGIHILKPKLEGVPSYGVIKKLDSLTVTIN
jgi:hypothetical protein